MSLQLHQKEKIMATGKGTETAETKQVESLKDVPDLEKAEKIVRNHMLVALGTGVVPPVIDIAALTGVQIRMLYVLAKNYNQKFSDDWGKSVIGSLLGGYGMAKLCTSAVHSLMKFIPGVGQIAVPVSMSVVAAASTYALGKVFIKHFESGGTLLNFNPEKMREYYYEQYEKGIKLAKKQTETDKAD